MKYELSAADQAARPAGYDLEPRYLGYRDSDRAQPYAGFFQARTRPVQEHVVHALVGGMAPTEYGYSVDEVADRLGRPGHEPLETGWTRLPGGVVMVSVHTLLPGVTRRCGTGGSAGTAAKPPATSCGIPTPTSTPPSARTAAPTDRQRYIGNVSYVDEYIGGRLQPLAIRFLDPEKMGIAPAIGTTNICARVGLSSHPLAFGWLIHQVRPAENGAEMRSRFFLGEAALLDLPARALPPGPAQRLLTSPAGRAVGHAAIPRTSRRFLPSTIGPDMIYHCAAEMNHLAGFLPDLHAQFKDDL